LTQNKSIDSALMAKENAGDATAEDQVGLITMKAERVPKDFNKVVLWFRKCINPALDQAFWYSSRYSINCLTICSANSMEEAPIISSWFTFHTTSPSLLESVSIHRRSGGVCLREPIGVATHPNTTRQFLVAPTKGVDLTSLN
jgi:hypothetical protein